MKNERTPWWIFVIAIPSAVIALGFLALMWMIGVDLGVEGGGW